MEIYQTFIINNNDISKIIQSFSCSVYKKNCRTLICQNIKKLVKYNNNIKTDFYFNMLYRDLEVDIYNSSQLINKKEKYKNVINGELGKILDHKFINITFNKLLPRMNQRKKNAIYYLLYF